MAYVSRYSTEDPWIQKSLKRIYVFNSGLFWAVRAAEKTAVSMLLFK